MLSLSVVTPNMAFTYYEHEDYFLKNEEIAKPRFFGQGKETLGAGAFSQEDFQWLAHGYNPKTKEMLGFHKKKKLEQLEFDKLKEKLKFGLNRCGVSAEVVESLQVNLDRLYKGKYLSYKQVHEFFHDHKATIQKAAGSSAQGRSAVNKLGDALKDLAKTDRRAGIDCTFSAPKSVSLAALVAGDKRLLKVHDKAVNVALGHIERELMGTLLGTEEARKFTKTGNLTAAQFTHVVSRAKDPQLHTHNVVLNATKCEDGVVRSFNSDALYKAKKSRGFGLYHRASKGLHRAWLRSGKQWEWDV